MRGTHSGRRVRRAEVVARRLSALLSGSASSSANLDRASHPEAADGPHRRAADDFRAGGGSVGEENGGEGPPAATLRSAPGKAEPIDPAASAGPSPASALRSAPDAAEPFDLAASARPSPASPASASPARALRSSALRSALSGRFDLETPGARALVLVGVVAALVAVGFLWLSRPRPQPVPAADVRPSLTAAPPAPLGPSASAAATVVVHVAGKVRHPGVVTLPAGARVTDAIKAAGGLRPGARLGVLNLARHVVDGEQILVGVGGQQAAPAVPGMPGVSGGAGGPAAAAPGAQLDLNAATVEQFDQLPGVGPVLAQRIIDYRTQHGGFRSIEELQDVTGIGDKKYAELKDLVRV